MSGADPFVVQFEKGNKMKNKLTGTLNTPIRKSDLARISIGQLVRVRLADDGCTSLLINYYDL